jgi:hypothetical protein
MHFDGVAVVCRTLECLKKTTQKKSKMAMKRRCINKILFAREPLLNRVCRQKNEPAKKSFSRAGASIQVL